MQEITVSANKGVDLDELRDLKEVDKSKEILNLPEQGEIIVIVFFFIFFRLLPREPNFFIYLLLISEHFLYFKKKMKCIFNRLVK